MASGSIPLTLAEPKRAFVSPSALLRGLWIVAALFHGWLVARRIAGADLLEPLNLARVLLGGSAVWYATLKFWRVSTVFDANPRRALIFFLAVFFGHGALHAAPEPDAASASAIVAVLPVVAFGVAAAAVLALVRVRLASAATPSRTRVEPSRFHARLPLSPYRFTVHLHRRPPPCAA